MTSNQFSSGLESANFLLTSDPVHQAWNAIEKQKQINPNAEPCLFNEIQPENPTIIAFGTPPSSLQGQEALVSSSSLKEDNFAHFEFLCNKTNPNFSLNQAAIQLFKSQYDELLQLKEKLVENSKSKTPSLVIITGQSVGGSVATLFTLWLLQGLNLSKVKRPLCVTFGSPLVGDEQLRQCVLKFSTWKSCFLHIVSNQDPTPQLFISRNPGAYKPFGTFLLCSALGCACLEDPDIILEQLVKTHAQNQECHYGNILSDLKCKALCNFSKSIEAKLDSSLQACLITQLQAIGILSQQQPSKEIDSLIVRMKKHETKLLIQKKKNSDSDKKLNEMKVHMAFLEWYKKESRQPKVGGYYDKYRNQGHISDVNVNEFKKKLMNYWEDSVTEVENKPQLEGAHFRVRWLWAGTNYRRMVEPLHIADYYKDGGKSYKTDGKRPKHFILLEEWLKKVDKPQEVPSKSKRQSVGSSLNEDSCFWAHVEEARMLCNLVKNGSIEEKECALQELKKFEAYVYGSLKNYALSPEIFLEKSSFMQWLKEYKGVVEQPYSSLLLDFMKERNDQAYKEGTFIFP
ncbi:PREDICTED: senescence-associated carboxylesterase 101-like isoform X1 [Fragaria vesca subsp. vesca]|uniref:senescence-associated carboxylesterase 101-like isoform X1 n=1 Tax=Fragaria vesca subsp. vesca TaxID=101020 RepID=UPI0002C30AAD|nr:PREDICTED: senescence-associated carboxylesterase 101-like isoform X1 [Fragaria vesca subsp. vesca]